MAPDVGTEGRLGDRADVMGVSDLTLNDLTDNVNSMANKLNS